MWRDAATRGISLATLLMLLILVAGLTGSVIIRMSILHYAVEVLGFSLAAVMLLVGGCMFSRQPLEDSKRYDEDGNPKTSWRMALLGFSLLVASVLLFLYGFLFTWVSVLLGF